jgi:hypothetical protein
MEMNTMMRALLTALAIAALGASCATKQQPQSQGPQLLQEKGATDIFAIPLDESPVEDDAEIKKLDAIGNSNAKKKELKAKEKTKAQPAKQ